MKAAQAIHLKVDSSPDHVEGVRLKCEALARELGFEEKEIGEIGLCVNEALANVIEHAYGFETGCPIEIWAEGIEGGMMVKIRDWGPGVDPSKLPEKEKDPLVPGGLGLICLREMMDSVEYAPQPKGDGGGLILKMMKKRK